ncbi:MAG TPA: protein kinase, partial [Candidatus Melainabacteria bacterium]|nr:protein kinase [Candidatus Melainabacteria bacterium]
MSDSDQNSSWFDRYKWCEPIAQGGMGVVYLAEDKGNGNARCVIKQLRSDTESPDEMQEGTRLFKREVDMLRSLDHPGIVRFFDYHSSEDGKYFLVMEHIQGNNLETIIQNYGPFSPDDAVKVGIQICE